MTTITSDYLKVGSANGSKMPFESKLTEQLGRKKEQSGEYKSGSPLSGSLLAEGRSSLKTRSLSDASRPSSPNLTNLPQSSKDDISIAPPETPQKVDRPTNLSLQLPSNIGGSGPDSVVSRAPLSPKLDPSHIYGSPVIPRRSRGLDFSRACTNLHLSTLAESSPDSSPVVGARGLSIPQRRNATISSGLSSPNTTHNPWPHSNHVDRPGISSSVSSVNMFDSDTTSSSDDDDESMHIIDREDPIITTPQVSRAGNTISTPFSPNANRSPGGDWMGGFSAAKASLMNFQRARFRSGRSKPSSSSAGGGGGSGPNSGPLSPPVLKSIETTGSNYFTKDKSMSDVKSRRESLSLGTSDLQLSDMSDDETRPDRISSPSSGSLAGSNPESGRRGVVRRPVTRRGSLLPKAKTFARIRAALFEEGAPLDFEAKREAEVIRQVRESEPDLPPPSPSLVSSGETLGPCPAVASPSNLPTETSAPSFSRQATKNSGGIEFWNNFDERYRTPPPSTRQTPNSVSGGDDAVMQTPPLHGDLASSCSSTPHVGPSRVAAEASRMGNKRRRDDDFDINSFKRRAVSPGMSAQNSPIVSQSSTAKENGRSGQLPKATIPHTSSHGSNTGEASPANNHTGLPKRVGLQGMNETNDGLMNMTID